MKNVIITHSPGNPGFPRMYTDYMASLFEQLHRRAWFVKYLSYHTSSLSTFYLSDRKITHQSNHTNADAGSLPSDI